MAYFRRLGISLNSRDREESTPLHWAAVSRAHTAASYIIAWGADIQPRDTAGFTPLHLAVRELGN